MQKFKIIFVIGSSLIVFACANLQQKQSNEVSPFSAQGWGGTSCNEMLHDIHPATGGKHAGQNIALYQSWISGFVSGVNYARDDVYDVSGATSPDDSFEWVKNYCLQNPIDPFPVALHKLIQHWQAEGKIHIDQDKAK